MGESVGDEKICIAHIKVFRYASCTAPAPNLQLKEVIPVKRLSFFLLSWQRRSRASQFFVFCLLCLSLTIQCQYAFSEENKSEEATLLVREIKGKIPMNKLMAPGYPDELNIFNKSGKKILIQTYIYTSHRVVGGGPIPKVTTIMPPNKTTYESEGFKHKLLLLDGNGNIINMNGKPLLSG